MLVVNRNTYGLQEYKKCRDIEISPTQFFVLDLLQSGKEVHVTKLIQWVKLKYKKELDTDKELTPNALYMQIRRLKEKGIEIEYKDDHYRLKEKEVWLV